MLQALYTLLRIYLLVLPFGQLLRLTFPGTSSAWHPMDVIVGLTFVITLIYAFLNQKGRKKGLHYLVIPIIVFASISLASLLLGATTLPVSETVVASFYWIRWVTYAGLLVTAFHVARNPTYRQGLQQTLLFSFTLLGILGLGQYLLLPDTRFLYFHNWDDHLNRLIGSFLDPGFTGVVLLLGLIYATQAWLGKDVNTKLRHLSFAAIPMLYVSMVLTYSRATFLSALAAALTWAWLRRSFKIVIFATIIFAGTWLMLPSGEGEGVKLNRTSTVNFRLLNYQQTIQVITDHPVTGVGFNRYRYIQRDYQFNPKWEQSHSASGADNSWLFVFATTGVLGIGAYLWLWFRIFRHAMPHSKKDIQRIAMVSTLVALVIHSQFHNTLFYPPVMGITWILLGLPKDDTSR